MYVNQSDLGRFDIPDGANWPVRITYFPEPPQAIRGSMNPWEEERKRQLFQLENEAWKKIQGLQNEYRQKANEFDAHARRFNQLVSELERQTGQSGLQKVMGSQGFNMASMAIGATNPYGTAILLAIQAVKFLEMGFKIISGEARRKKKRIAELTKALENEQKYMENIYRDMQQLASNILYLTQTRDRGMIQQSENVKIELTNNAMQAAQRRAAYSTAGAAHAAKAAAARLLPRGTYNDAL